MSECQECGKDKAEGGREFCNDCAHSLKELTEEIRALVLKLRAKNEEHFRRTGVRIRE